MTGLPETVPITLQRGAPDEASRTETYDVPYREGMSVLDAVVWIRTNVDSSVAFRYSCVNANACKECMVRVNDKVDYACTARLTSEPMTIEPLSNKRLIRDLVTDIVPPKEQLSAVAESRKK